MVFALDWRVVGNAERVQAKFRHALPLGRMAEAEQAAIAMRLDSRNADLLKLLGIAVATK